MKRFLVEKIDKDMAILDGMEHNHLKNVLRCMPGQEVILNCADGFDYHAVIKSIGKNSTVLQVISKEKNAADPTVDLTLFQALIKKDGMSLVVQKCTELGLTTLIPFESRYTTVKDKLGKSDKLQQIANQSTKQCRRSIPLKIEETVSFNEMLKRLKEFDLVIFANETEKINVLDLHLNQYKKVAIIVGCEGGFDTGEIQSIIACGAKSITLGKRILRAETAAIALSSIVMHIMEANS